MIKKNFFMRTNAVKLKPEYGGKKATIWIIAIAIIVMIIVLVVWGSTSNWFGLITYKGNINLTVKLESHFTGLSKIDMNLYVLDSGEDQIYQTTIRAPDYKETLLSLNPGGQQTLYVRVSSTTTTRWYTVWASSKVTGAILSSEMVKVGNYYYLKIDSCQSDVVLTVNIAPESTFDLDIYNNHTWSASSFTVSHTINQSGLSLVYNPVLYLKANSSFHYLNVTRFTTSDGQTTPTYNETTKKYECSFPVNWLENSDENEVENDIILKFEGTIPTNTTIQINATLEYQDFNMHWRTGLEFTFYITRP